MTAYPNDKSRVIVETDNTIDKLTHEYLVSPAYSCLEMSHFCLTQIAATYENNDLEVPPDLKAFLTKTYPELVKDQKSLIEEQYLKLNTSGSA